MDNDFLVVLGHIFSPPAILGALLGFFPAVAGLAGFIFYCIQIWESKTVQDYVKARQARQAAKIAAQEKDDTK